MSSSGKRFSLAVTGVDGFVGGHVAALAAELGMSVCGVSRASSIPDELAGVLDSYHSADLTIECPELPEVDAVLHLAGRAAVGPSFAHPQQYLADNSAMVTTLCESVLKSPSRPRIIGVSTGAVYAASPEPITEDAPIRESSPYVVSKLLVEHQLRYYRERGLDTVIARPFNHVGPGQGPGFIVPDLFSRLEALDAGAPLAAGDLTTARDYTDVRDVARAFLLLAQADSVRHTVYNVANGVSHSGIQILTLIAAALGRPVPEIVTEPALARPAEERVVVGSARRLREEFGWVPQHTIEDSIRAFADRSGHLDGE
ncbi:NAD-dependent epimerase/dehydratase family protein [Microbacterium sp.]|uniref:NAD-dependent epimerase/dehydratase family protein n=1 Tax=Microbacterium sp. TaxID=51671 RepID=UPI0025EF45CA|nr:NAD-dependent epimerase/dehydratase family protein [Microbacterium sp.]